MAQSFSTGPVHVWLAGLPTAAIVAAGIPVAPFGPFAYYGTTRTGPDITEHPAYYDIMTDFSGPSVPHDRLYIGCEHTIVLQMTRWDGGVDLFLDSRPE